MQLYNVFVHQSTIIQYTCIRLECCSKLHAIYHIITIHYAVVTISYLYNNFPSHGEREKSN